jgi:hypothetical protein
VLAACVALPANASAAGYEVGAALRSINPTQAEIDSKGVHLGGFGATGLPELGDRYATGILGEGPSVRAFVVSAGSGQAVAMADMELQGWFAATKDGPYGIVDMRRQAAARTGLRPDQIFIQSDHSHAGADAMGVWGGIPLAYRRRIFDRTVDAIVDAWDHRRAAASLVYGTADGSNLLNNQFSYDPDNRTIDGDVRVLQARDAAGEAIATLVNFSAHADVIGGSNTRISGDWVQRANPRIEELTGGTAVTMVGTLGRTQPSVRDCDVAGTPPQGQDLCKLDHYGRLVANKVRDALANAHEITGPAKVLARSYLVQDPSSNPFLLGIMFAGDAIATPLNRSLAPPWLTGNVVGTVTGTALIGDVLVSSVPGEIYPQIAEAVRDAVGKKARGFMTLGLSGDQLGYIIAPFPGAYKKPICATLFEDCADTLPVEPGALPNDNYLFNVSPTMGERVTCSLLRGADETLGTQLRAARTMCKAFANDQAMPSGADVSAPPTSALDETAINGSGSGPVRAAVGEADASWHVGASAGQYASTKEDIDPTGEIDPNVLEFKNLPSYGLQSRLSARALVIEDASGKRFAIVKNDLYIPQDLLWRRTAQILADHGSKVTQQTLTMAVTHDHSSPYYSSTGVGAWTFQDAFDVRFFEYYAQKQAKAIEDAEAHLVPAKIGASVGTLDKVHRHSFGPAIADDGTPAGYPQSDADHDLTVLRVDSAAGKPLGMLVNYSVHGEGNDGNDLISADWVGPLQRMVDRETGALMVYTQNAVGTAEMERSTYHDMHERLDFNHRNYAQGEFAARLMADEVEKQWRKVDSADARVPFATSMPVRMADRWYPGPLSHPLPTVSNCRSDHTRIPVIGLPDCQDAPIPTSPAELTGQDPGVSLQTLREAGIPVPENVSAPSYGALEEDVSVHMQALRLGEIVLTMCSCEQWADQARNIKTRTDQIRDNQYVGYKWADRCEPSGGQWSCVNPQNETQRLTISDALYKKMRAQVANDAVGWDSLANVATAESEPVDPAKIKGNYTHEELAPANGYQLTVPLGMVNDYNGYIATYREYQRGDHYRKALTAWGPHSSDYFATRLVQLAGHLKQPGAYVLPTEDQRELADSLGRAKTIADQAFNDAKARAAGEAGSVGSQAYAAALPDDGGDPGAVRQPSDVQRFGAALFSWRGGSNYTDDPQVVVQRKVDGQWVDYADQTGEVPVTVQFPRLDDDSVPDYAQGSFEWKWTATFEAFVAPFDTGDRGRATPAGEYRFVVDGHHRSGRAATPYHVVSRVFTVSPWAGITAEDVRLEADGTVSLSVGPRREVPIPGLAGVTGKLGPIDYPDSYTGEGVPRFIKSERTAIADPRAPKDPDKVEWYCFTCTFRPWIDQGDADSVDVTVTHADGSTQVVPAHRDGARWRTDYKLAVTDSAAVAAGGIRDAWGNRNGATSAVMGPAPKPETPGPVATATPTVETPPPVTTTTPAPAAPAAPAAPTATPTVAAVQQPAKPARKHRRRTCAKARPHAKKKALRHQRKRCRKHRRRS